MSDLFTVALSAAVGMLLILLVIIAVMRYGRSEPALATLIRTLREGAEYTGGLQVLEEAVRTLRRREADARGRPEEHALVPGLVAAERLMYETWDAMRDADDDGEGAEEVEATVPPLPVPPPPNVMKEGCAAPLRPDVLKATHPPVEKQQIVDWGFSCGRHYLTVAGFIVAMEGDPIRDADVFAFQDEAARKLDWRGWDGTAIKAVCAAANKEKL
jgi:hypothetical protein